MRFGLKFLFCLCTLCCVFLGAMLAISTAYEHGMCYGALAEAAKHMGGEHVFYDMGWSERWALQRVGNTWRVLFIVDAPESDYRSFYELGKGDSVWDAEDNALIAAYPPTALLENVSDWLYFLDRKLIRQVKNNNPNALNFFMIDLFKRIGVI